VEHSGFSTLNNQRFGAQFVDEVANPAEILLFHRKKRPQDVKKGGGGKKRGSGGNLMEPIAPEDLAEVSVEDLIRENLQTDEKKLEVLDESTMSVALDDFVNKAQTSAIVDAVASKLNKTQKKLIKSGGSELSDGKNISALVAADTEALRRKAEADDELREKVGKSIARRLPKPNTTAKVAAKKKTTKKRRRKGEESSEKEEKEKEDVDLNLEDDEEEDIDDIEKNPPPARSKSTRARKSSKKSYVESDDECVGGGGVVDMTADRDGEEKEIEETLKRGKRKASPKKKTPAPRGGGARKPRQVISVESDSDSDGDAPMPKGWGGSSGGGGTSSGGRKRMK